MHSSKVLNLLILTGCKSGSTNSSCLVGIRSTFDILSIHWIMI